MLIKLIFDIAAALLLVYGAYTFLHDIIDWITDIHSDHIKIAVLFQKDDKNNAINIALAKKIAKKNPKYISGYIVLISSENAAEKNDFNDCNEWYIIEEAESKNDRGCQ